LVDVGHGKKVDCDFAAFNYGQKINVL
jgi:hypothetical protein